MMQGVEEIAVRGQSGICKLLRRLGVNQEESETTSMETSSVATVRVPYVSEAEVSGDFFSG
jgi:hypothetical protein